MDGLEITPDGGLVVSIKDATKLAKQAGWKIHWRPDPELPETVQYAVVYGG